jgi:DNA uptake protein ComE-like DNA-binding protein
MALIAVLLVMGATVLVATSLLFVAQAEYAGSARTDDTAQARALAWSGVQAAMVRLNEQRQEILDGGAPRLDGQFVVYETASRLGVARLLPVGPAGEYLVPEAGKLDVNGVDAGILAATSLVDDAQAGAIIAYRDRTLGRPIQSVGELLRVDGVSAETLYGPIEALGATDDEERQTGDMDAALGSGAPVELRGLADAVTVYSFEPAIQRNGKLRINLNVPWSDELGRRVADRFGSEVAQTLQRIMESGTTFETEAKIFQVLRFFDVPVDDWPDIVDTFTTEAGDFHFGRLDINTAPYEALAALPGIDPDQAQEIVKVRDELDPDERSTVAWPAIQGILEPEAYDLLAGRITTRCWTWRLRVAAGEVDAEAPEAPLVNPIVYEVVIDLSAPRPRVAFLRDITFLRTTALIAGAAGPEPQESWERDEQAGPDSAGQTSATGDDSAFGDESATGDDFAAGEVAPPGGEYADEDDLGPADDPFGDMAGGVSGDVPAVEQPGGPAPVSAGGAADASASPAPAPTTGPRRTRIGRWTAG